MNKETAAINRVKELRALARCELSRAVEYEQKANEARWSAEINNKLADWMEKNDVF